MFTHHASIYWGVHTVFPNHYLTFYIPSSFQKHTMTWSQHACQRSQYSIVQRLHLASPILGNATSDQFTQRINAPTSRQPIASQPHNSMKRRKVFSVEAPYCLYLISVIGSGCCWTYSLFINLTPHRSTRGPCFCTKDTKRQREFALRFVCLSLPKHIRFNPLGSCPTSARQQYRLPRGLKLASIPTRAFSKFNSALVNSVGS
ncbi:hypothetical protein B0J11DRAFT_255182 [Dendryphion nanum]|uniref:Uncharacterized protein n=1 Tax=Dendryphion nanum TaxID=256645 RepID=A0A9P9E4J4_9PLEO|nr:hypothetical protein B0J11DRAFT_255182 [Dendryphion nanum]